MILRRFQWTSYEKGLWSEVLCAGLLILKGYRLLAWRMKTPLGELDLVVWHRKTVIVVEVKRRQNPENCGSLVSPHQLQRLRRGLALFIKNHPHFRTASLRGDVMIHRPWSWPKHLKDVL